MMPIEVPMSLFPVLLAAAFLTAACLFSALIIWRDVRRFRAYEARYRLSRRPWARLHPMHRVRR
jgi:hypothetical protein